MNPVMAEMGGYLIGIPRVSGDEPITVGTNVARILYSPRERG